MVKRSFLSDMRCIESAIKRQEVSASGKAVFRSLVRFVESCPFSRSKSFQFLCRNWRLNYDGLSRIWTSENGESKNQATFRVQVSQLSKMLYSMFPTFSRDLFISDIHDEATENDLQEIKDTIEALCASSGYPDELFIPEVLSYADNLCIDNDVSVEDCLATASQLKPLLKTEVSAYLGGLDQNQLKYILSVLQQPLFGARSVECNMEKVALLKAIGVSDAVLSNASQEKPAKVKEVYVEVPEKTPYNLAIGKTLSDVITKRANDRLTDEDIRLWTEMTEKERDVYKGRLAHFLTVFTEAGLMWQLAHYNPLALKEVLDGYYPVKEGEEVYEFRK